MSEPQTAEQINTPQTGKVTVDSPPAATVVLNGDRTERELDLENKVKREEKLRIDREKRISELEDELHQLKQVAKPEPKAKAEQKQEPKNRWRFTLMDTGD